MGFFDFFKRSPKKVEQRNFGITENLLKKPVPKFYGAGEHKVQLAYITPA